MTKVKRFASLFLVIAMLFTAIATIVACTPNKVDNEKTRLVLSTGELDGVFNPFFSSSATDGNIVGMTQLSMLSADKNGNVAYGEKEACAVLDYEQSVASDNSSTTYKFVLKNGLKFSDGSPLTMRDVLFNLYVYLDPAYTGSSTIYSTEIVGLAEYRTQSKNASEQEGFEETFEGYGWNRIQRLYDTLEEIYEVLDGTGTDEATWPTDANVRKALQEKVAYYQDLADNEQDEVQKEMWTKYTTMVDDYDKTKELFLQELKDDYKNSIGTAEDIKFDGDRIHLTTDTEAFFYNEGLITWNEKENKLDYAVGAPGVSMSQEEAINTVYNMYTAMQTASANLTMILIGSNSTNTLVAEFTALEKEAFFNQLEDEDRIWYIEGITYANRNESVTVNGKTYAKTELNDDYTVANDTNEVLQIVIKDVDPKAIWNFGFTIAPMFYYSSPEQIALFDYDTHFGVAFSSLKFMNEWVKNPNTIGLPVGAGPYKATTKDGQDKIKLSSGTFWDNNVVYFERNEHFLLGPAKIKYVNYQVVSDKQMLDSLFNGDIHFAEPQAKQKNIQELNNHKKKGFDGGTVMTNGYGYIGINAEKVPNVYVRQAIMHAINTQLCLDYYAGYSYPIYRPMTRASWAYPSDTDSQGQYYKYDGSGETSKALVIKGGYTSEDSKGVRNNGKDSLKYTFTIAGDSIDHPAYDAMMNAAKILNKIGFDITVQKDLHALKKLNTGDLTVWAAAWGSGVDPDMYQIYHIDSLAGSTQNWGYRAIRRDKGTSKYAYEYGKIVELSGIIDEARETLDQNLRKDRYAQALDLVMDLAVELPTYQRSDMFAYNTKVIDASTLTPEKDLTPFNGPLARLWEVSLKVK